MRAKFVAAFCFALSIALAPARANDVSMGAYFYNVPGSALQRPADTTAYAANQTVCASKSAACVPGTISVAMSQGQLGFGNRITLGKTGATTTNASFTIWLYSALPGLASPLQEDATAYTGPRLADLPNYIGNAVCATPIATSDSSPGVWYECTLSNPNTAGALVFTPAPNLQTVYYLISVNAAYTPVSGETFTPYASGFY